MPARERDVSLASRLFGFTATPGCHSAQQQAPDAWVRQLITQHPEVRLGLLTSCRAGRELILQTSPKSRVCIAVDNQLSRRARARQLSSVLEAIRVRSPLPTALVFEWDSNVPETVQVLLALPERFRAVRDLITAVWLEDLDEGDSEVAGQFVQRAGQVFPSLTTLTAPCCIFPAPSALPGLRELTVYRPQADDVYSPPAQEQHLSVAAFLPQITSFSYLPHLDDQLEPIWADVLTPAPPTTPSAITHFTTYHPLSDELLSALLSHAPALKQLTVDQIDLLESHRGEQWGLERLRLTNMETPDVSRLALLPTRATGTLQVRSNDAWQIRVSAEEGMDEVTLARLSEWEFVMNQGPNGRVLDQYEQDFYYKTDTFIIEPTEMTVFMYLTTALRNVLRQLAAIQTDSPRHALFELYRWVWTPELVAVFVEEAAALPPRLKFQIDINELSDTVLATMLPLAARASRLTTREVAMKSDDHAQVPWPWEMLQVTDLSLSELLRLPDSAAAAAAAAGSSGCMGRRELQCSRIQFPDALAQTDRQRLMNRLQHLQISPERLCDSLLITLPPLPQPTTHNAPQPQSTITRRTARASTAKPTTHNAPQPPSRRKPRPATATQDPHAELLSQQIAMLQAMSVPTGKASVKWSGPLTHATMAALAGLPSWVDDISLTECTWPLKPAEYKSLARYIPLSVSTWRLEISADSHALKQICAGVDENRGGRGLRPISLELYGQRQDDERKAKPGGTFHLELNKRGPFSWQ